MSVSTPLNASASSAGALISNATFEVPQFQREYSWGLDEVTDFWNDLKNNMDSDTYFIGLVILTDQGGRKHVVDGQQRLITLSLLATAIYHEAQRRGRSALADRIQADFLRSIDYESDKTDPRIRLSDENDDQTFQHILNSGSQPPGFTADDSVSSRMWASYDYISRRLSEDLSQDPFKRLGRWTEFITHKLYFAVFVHPDPSSAYQVYEVINTRGKELTTADLLKNYILSQTSPASRQDRYNQWQRLSKQFATDGTNNFVQYIRHVVTVNSGHILPKDLFAYLAGRTRQPGRIPPTPDDLMLTLEDRLPLYLQMIDPTAAGPAEANALGVFTALNSLGVIAVRPLLLAISDVPDAQEGMEYVLRLVVRRIVVGNLGTGNVERRLSETAKNIHQNRDWRVAIDELSDLNPEKGEFIGQLRKRSFNKAVLSFLRRSIVQKTITPNTDGVLHFIWTKQVADWFGVGEEEGSYWASTIGNTYLSEQDRRPREATTWEGFRRYVLPYGVDGEWRERLEAESTWDAETIEDVGDDLAQAAGELWF